MIYVGETGLGYYIIIGTIPVFVLFLAYLISILIEPRVKDKTKLEGIKIVLYSVALYIIYIIYVAIIPTATFSPFFSVFVVFGIVFLYLFWKLTTKLK